MTKNYILTSKRAIRSFLLLITICLNINVSAQILLNDSFEYLTENLYENGAWVKYGTVTTNPILLIDEALFYPNYQETPIGKGVALKDLTGSQKLVAKFTEGNTGINSGVIYYSALINVKEAKSVANFIISLVQKPGASSNVGDGLSGTEYAKLFIQQGATADKFKFGIDRGGLTPTMTVSEYELNTTYLIIMKYEFIDGITNDKVSLYINPTATEPMNPIISYDGLTGSEVNTSRGIQGIQLRQGATSTKASPIATIDALKVATSYGALFGSSEPETKPTITLSTKNIGYNNVYIGNTYTKTVNVKGKDLKGDIQIEGMTTSEVSTSTITILKEDAESEHGYDLTVTLTPTNLESYTDVVKFNSEGANEQKISIFWSAEQLIEVATLMELANKTPENYETYKYTGQAIVSFIDNKSYYIQDATCGFRINDAYNDFVTTPSIGDKISNFIITVENSFGIYGLPAQNSPLNILSSNNKIVPVVVTLQNLVANPKNYFNQLVKIENVTFKSIGGQDITIDTPNPTINDGTADGTMRLFKSTDIIGTKAPIDAIDLVGVSTSEAVAVIGPRSLEDMIIDNTPKPSLTINAESLTGFTATIGGEHKQTIQYTSANLSTFGSAKIMGEGGGTFFINNTMLMKNGTFDISITFKPKNTGVFTERIEFSAKGIETFYLTVTGTANGESVDEKEGDELPLITSNPKTLLIEDFSTTIKNKPLSLNGWKNIASIGNRAWWGYEFTESNEKTAKITAYDSKVEANKGTPCEMILITPPLDFINSQSKVFTFRIMGDLLLDNQTDKLEVCYIDMENGEMYVAPIEMQIPANADNNKEWLEIHIDLENTYIADIFFMGFRFKSTRGIDNAATYFIDDVTYGRTDIPKLSSPTPAIAFETVVNNEYITEPIMINTKNLNEEITLSIGGANRSKFELTNTTLPIEGGSFNIKFNSKDVGVHEAYIKASSRGAADLFIPISVNNKSDDTGIESVIENNISDVTIYDTNGKLIKTVVKVDDYKNIIDKLISGSYVLNVKNITGIYSFKVVIP